MDTQLNINKKYKIHVQTGSRPNVIFVISRYHIRTEKNRIHLVYKDVFQLGRSHSYTDVPSSVQLAAAVAWNMAASLLCLMSFGAMKIFRRHAYMYKVLPQQQMQMTRTLPWHTIQLDYLQITVQTVSPKGQIWETNWICQEQMDIVIRIIFMPPSIKKKVGESATVSCSLL